MWILVAGYQSRQFIFAYSFCNGSYRNNLGKDLGWLYGTLCTHPAHASRNEFGSRNIHDPIWYIYWKNVQSKKHAVRFKERNKKRIRCHPKPLFAPLCSAHARGKALTRWCFALKCDQSSDIWGIFVDLEWSWYLRLVICWYLNSQDEDLHFRTDAMPKSLLWHLWYETECNALDEPGSLEPRERLRRKRQHIYAS